MTAFTDSHLHCVRCGKRLTVDIGANENDGVVEIVHRCISCEYSEQAPRTVAEAYRRSDVPQVQAVHQSLRELLDKQRREGVVVPLRIDDAPFSEEEF